VQTKNAAVESSRMNLLSPFTPSQLTRGRTRKRLAVRSGAPGSAMSKTRDSQRYRPTANSALNYQ
jgi:hypothetical protein